MWSFVVFFALCYLLRIPLNMFSNKVISLNHWRRIVKSEDKFSIHEKILSDIRKRVTVTGGSTEGNGKEQEATTQQKQQSPVNEELLDLLNQTRKDRREGEMIEGQVLDLVLSVLKEKLSNFEVFSFQCSHSSSSFLFLEAFILLKSFRSSCVNR